MSVGHIEGDGVGASALLEHLTKNGTIYSVLLIAEERRYFRRSEQR